MESDTETALSSEELAVVSQPAEELPPPVDAAPAFNAADETPSVATEARTDETMTAVAVETETVIDLDEPRPSPPAEPGDAKPEKLGKKEYQQQLAELQPEIIRMQELVRASGGRVLVLCDGRDTGRNGGVVQRIADASDLRWLRPIALPPRTERERRQWFFQRYVAHLPAAGEMAFFDGSWYGSALVEKTIGLRSDDDYLAFLDRCGDFETMLGRAGFTIVKYWIAVTEEEEEPGFRSVLRNLAKRWGVDAKDVDSCATWDGFVAARQQIFDRTSRTESPWYFITADGKREARLACIRHLVEHFPPDAA